MLILYKLNAELGTFQPYSSGDDVSNIIRSVFNGQDGGTIIQKLYIRNDGKDRFGHEVPCFYSQIILGFGPAEKVGVNNLRKFSYKLLAGDAEPTEKEWASATSGVGLDYRQEQLGRRFYIANIGEVGSEDQKYYPIWLRIDVPPKTAMGVILDTKITLNYEESPV